MKFALQIPGPPWDCRWFGQWYFWICTWYPHWGLSWTQEGKVDLPINQNKSNRKFYKKIMYKIKIEGGLFYEKIVNSCIWCSNLQAILEKLWFANQPHPDCELFWQKRGLPISRKWTNLKTLQQFTAQNPNWKGVHYLIKIANSCIFGPTMRVVSNKWTNF